MRVTLQKIGPTEDGRAIVVDHFPFVIGRRGQNDCSLPLACISRRHCRLTQEGEQVLVHDLESYHGTFVNGRRALIPLPLVHGDELSLGPILFRVLMGADVQETEPGRGITQGESPGLVYEDGSHSAGRSSA